MIQIVIVDDEADTHLLYKLKLKKLFANYGELNLVSFLNGVECLDYIKNPSTPHIDLVLSDINMPEMDGFELLESVRKFDKKLLFYMVSAYESSDYRNKAEQLGANQFISKPVDFSTLVDILRRDLQLDA